MNYRVEALTPLLAGDGSELSPVDYMVWRDQVNVLDQERIFRLLSRGPRLDSYLLQIKKADKLDFTNWGGFAQNYAGRRIAFEHPSCARQWERQHADDCHIPCFSTSPHGPYLPGSALRGALRTAVVAARIDDKTLSFVKESMGGERPSRRPAEAAEHRALSRDSRAGYGDQFKALPISDSATVDRSFLKVFMLRVAALTGAPGGKPGLGWKYGSSSTFAEMAMPGTVFEGRIVERAFYGEAETMKGLHWRDTVGVRQVAEAANAYAAIALDNHARYAAAAGLEEVAASVAGLQGRLAEIRESGEACLVALGWGTGLLGKTAWPKVEDEAYREVLRTQAYYSRAIRTGLPFPKTRRIVFLNDRPAALPGWVLVRFG